MGCDAAVRWWIISRSDMDCCSSDKGSCSVSLPICSGIEGPSIGPTSAPTGLAPEARFDGGASVSLLLRSRGLTTVKWVASLLRSDVVGALGIGTSSSSLLLS